MSFDQTMKVFHTFEKQFAYAIVRATESDFGYQNFFNRYKHLLIILLKFCACVPLVQVFFVRDFNVQEYTETIYALTTTSGMAVMLKMFECRKQQIFGMIDSFTEMVEEREHI